MTNGIEITESGVDIPTAHDSQRILDSRFRYLEIAQEAVITFPALLNDGSVQVIYTHNLGFLPAFDVYDTVLNEYILIGGLLSDKNRLYFNGFYTDDGWSNHKVVIRIYNVPITEEYIAPFAQTLPVKPSSISEIGLEILSPPTSFSETELSKYQLTTKGKALAIQRTGLQTSNSGTNFQIIIQHDMGLPPTFLATFADSNREWVKAINPDFIPVKSFADGKTLTFTGVQSVLTGTIAYIIFKELGDFAL